MPYNLKGRNVLVTGGSAGLGELISTTFAKEGANVAINYFNRIEPAQKVQKACEEQGVKAVVIKADMTSTSEAKRAVQETIKQLGGLDIVIANAGWTRFADWKDLDSVSEEEWDKCWSANVKVPKALLSEARATFDANPDGGQMITTGSIAAVSQVGSSMPYAVTKAAQVQLVKCLAVTVGPKIRVNTVLPGLLLTEWGLKFPEERIQQGKDAAALKHETFLDDCVDAFVMLAKNTSMTGMRVQVDAGLTIQAATSVVSEKQDLGHGLSLARPHDPGPSSRAGALVDSPRPKLRISAKLTEALNHDSLIIAIYASAMSSPLSPVARVAPRLSRRCMRCGQRSDSCQPARRRWMSSVRDGPAKRPKTAIFFPGQGVQRVGMCAPWLEAFPSTAKPILEEIDQTLGLALTRIIEFGTNAELTRTENAQPAIMATSILILRILEKEFGFKTGERVDVTLGHSLGEFAALVAGGYLTFQDALKMVRKRAEVMAKCSQEAVAEEGGEFGMVALVCESEEHMQALIHGIHEFLALGSKADSSDHLPAVQQVAIANLNSKNQIVLSGSITRISTLLTNLRQFGGHDPRHVRLKSDAPFHSLLMKPAQETMKRILHKETEDGRDIVTWPGILPCISNVSGKPFTDKEQLKDLLARSCVETVQWWKSIKYLHEKEKIMRYVGIGPGKVGRNLVGKEVGMKGSVKGGGVWGITSPKEMEEVVRALDDTENSDVE
ncbi:malonyl-CoA-acyl carrier protein transacylase [Stemphylium lycopersici]|uniref:[acyl-carrier-protein] S-malonyltransferase n=1 Tax=Stemphylium lycopersici TaxID=183478 RepID=A0A364N5Y7_STELY|nr:malonyl-CoA-acyl carrier protein transacylase [Stemphylium lycopersici]RAR12647.1 malonyl-CoA-acyl carrier protein transacylase [Stemphylium lycopersici]